MTTASSTIKIILALIGMLPLLISCNTSKQMTLFENHLYKFNYPKDFKTASLEVEPKTYIYAVYDTEDKNDQNILRFSTTPDNFDLDQHYNYVTNTEPQLFENKGREIIKANQDTIINNYKGKYYRFKFAETLKRKAYNRLDIFLTDKNKYHHFVIETPQSAKENKQVFNIFKTLEIK